jgi:hypothetical protein
LGTESQTNYVCGWSFSHNNWFIYFKEINDYYQQNELMDIDFNTNTYWDDNTNCFLIITKPDTEIEMNGCWDNIINLIKEII